MTEQELRELVRRVLAERAGGHSMAEPSHGRMIAGRQGSSAHGDVRQHASHGLFVLEGTGDGSCLVEPAARCTHCGFCKSYGH